MPLFLSDWGFQGDYATERVLIVSGCATLAPDDGSVAIPLPGVPVCLSGSTHHAAWTRKVGVALIMLLPGVQVRCRGNRGGGLRALPPRQVKHTHTHTDTP